MPASKRQQLLLQLLNNLACQVSPLEDTLGSTKRNCRTQQETSTPSITPSLHHAITPSLHHSITPIQHKPKSRPKPCERRDSEICRYINIYRIAKQKEKKASPGLDEITSASLDLQEAITAPQKISRETRTSRESR